MMQLFCNILYLFQIARKKEKKLFLIAQEVVSSERVFVDVLRLLNVVSVTVVKCSHMHVITS